LVIYVIPRYQTRTDVLVTFGGQSTPYELNAGAAQKIVLVADLMGCSAGKIKSKVRLYGTRL